MSSYDDPRWYEQPGQQGQADQPQEQKQQPNADIYRSYLPQNNDSAQPLQREPAYIPDKQTPQDIDTEPRPGRRSFGRIFGQVVVIGALIVIAYIGGWFSHQIYSTSFNASDESRSYANLIQQAWFTIDQNYVDRKAINYKQMSYKAIQQMVAVLNDKGHTRFETPEEVAAENQQLSGNYTGIGIYLRQDPTNKQLSVISTIPGSPAEKAGFKPNDILLAVNGTDVQGKDTAFVSNLIHGDAGTKVTVKIKRPSTGQTLNLTAVRANIKVQNVILHYIPESHIAHIQVVQFADGVTDQLKAALAQAKKDGATKIILDLRDNPGGYLQEAIDTASLFMKSGNVLLEQDSKGNRTPYAVNGDPLDTRSPLVILVNNNSASAAEIVSGSLQDNHRATLIGTKTFGTGTVLQQFKLSDGSALLLGTSEWLTPNGKFIRGNGITPNIIVQPGSRQTPLTPNEENESKLTEKQILAAGDAQLDAAINFLNKTK